MSGSEDTRIESEEGEVTPRLITTGALFSLVKTFAKKYRPAGDVTALDVCAGAGALTRYLAEELKCRVRASDIDPEKWEYGLIPIDIADLGRELPYQDESFDMVICQEGLKHVTDCATAIAELARVAKPGAPILVTIPNDLALQTKARYFCTGFVDIDRDRLQTPGATDDKEFLYVSSSVQLPLLYYFIKKNRLEYVESATSRVRGGSALLAFLLAPIIKLWTKKLAGDDPVLYRELTSTIWLAGRHNLIVMRKPL